MRPNNGLKKIGLVTIINLFKLITKFKIIFGNQPSRYRGTPNRTMLIVIPVTPPLNEEELRKSQFHILISGLK